MHIVVGIDINDLEHDPISQDVDLIVVINASPFYVGKGKEYEHAARNVCTRYNVAMIYVNQVGGQDEMIFDGGSFIMNNKGNYDILPVFWREEIIYHKFCDNINVITVHTKLRSKSSILQPGQMFETEEYDAEIYQALMISLRDYVQKNGFHKVLLGLSGGVDSALVATIAVDTLGSENVRCVALPSEFSSEHSKVDAQILAHDLGCEFDVISIDAAKDVIGNSLAGVCGKFGIEKTGENIQARIRGIMLMAISNKFNELLLSTSNKSESAVGYTTIYGDMCGGFALIGDLYKTQIYRIVKWRNRNIPYDSKLERYNIIPASIINKEPSAELKPNQYDKDTLPPYHILDKILYWLIEEPLEITAISVKLSVELEVVSTIHNMLLQSEFKRMQSPCAPKISKRCFRYERKYPLSNGFRVDLGQKVHIA
ncbi:Glutamine-dependent NAD(+) synthetase [Alphaproteobacteria bacterium]